MSTGSQLLLAFGDGDGTAARDLRLRAEEVLTTSGHPLHVASLVTRILAGWTISTGYPEEAALDGALYSTAQNGAYLSAPLVPGSFVDVVTETKTGSIFAEVLCSHLDPSAEAYEADGRILDATQDRRRGVLSVASMPPELRPEPTRLERIRRGNRWLTTEGHLIYHAPEDQLDSLARYCRWLCDDARTPLRAALPSDEAALNELLRGIVSGLSAYERTFVRAGAWMWLRTPYEAAMVRPLERSECRRLLKQTLTTNDTDTVRRTLANELRYLVRTWSKDEKAALADGPRWLTALFVANAFIAERTVAEVPPLVRTPRCTVEVQRETEWGLAGLWRVRPLAIDEEEEIRRSYRERGEERSLRDFERELQTHVPYPFHLRLSRDDFENGTLSLPAEVRAQLRGSKVTVRLAYTPIGQFSSRPVAVAATCAPDELGCVPFEWPAVLPVGSQLDGSVVRGRLIELRPSDAQLCDKG